MTNEEFGLEICKKMTKIADEVREFTDDVDTQRALLGTCHLASYLALNSGVDGHLGQALSESGDFFSTNAKNMSDTLIKIAKDQNGIKDAVD